MFQNSDSRKRKNNDSIKVNPVSTQVGAMAIGTGLVLGAVAYQGAMMAGPLFPLLAGGILSLNSRRRLLPLKIAAAITVIELITLPFKGWSGLWQLNLLAGVLALGIGGDSYPMNLQRFFINKQLWAIACLVGLMLGTWVEGQAETPAPQPHAKCNTNPDKSITCHYKDGSTKTFPPFKP